jgi:hypothetical protein
VQMTRSVMPAKAGIAQFHLRWGSAKPHMRIDDHDR